MQRISWQAAAQLGKLLGHSEMLGNPVGMLFETGSGIACGVRGVGRGIARGDGDQIVMGGKQLMGSVVGGAAGLGARLTGSLHSIVQRLTESIHKALLGLESEGHDKVAFSGGSGALAEPLASGHRQGSVVGGSALLDVRRGLHLSLKEALKEEGKEALRGLARALAALLLRPLQGANKGGTLGLARGVADGVINFVLLPIGATLETVPSFDRRMLPSCSYLCLSVCLFVCLSSVCLSVFLSLSFSYLSISLSDATLSINLW